MSSLKRESESAIQPSASTSPPKRQKIKTEPGLASRDDWHLMKLRSGEELRLDLTLPSGQSFRWSKTSEMLIQLGTQFVPFIQAFLSHFSYNLRGHQEERRSKERPGKG